MSETAALALVTALSGARKAFSLYPRQHPEHVGALGAFDTAIREATMDGPFTLNVHLGRLYHDSRVLPAEVPGVRSTAETFESHRIESLTFYPSYTDADMAFLLDVLARRPSPWLDVAATLEQAGVSGIVVRHLETDEAAQAEERKEQRESDRALYRRLVGALKQVTAQVVSSGSPSLGDATAMVEGILERFLADSPAVLGLATLRDHTEADLFHAINTMIYALTIGSGLGIPQEGLISLGVSAVLHDIGKIAFDRTDPEQQQRATLLHPTVGAEILSRLTGIDQVALLVTYEHHMRPGGAGWPETEPGYVAHPYSRIVAIADRYDRLTGEQPAGAGLTPDRALVQLLRETGDGLDQMFTRVFVRQMGVFPVGCLVRLSDHSAGVVCAPGEDPLQPRVRIIYGPDGLAVERETDTELAGSDLTIVEVVQPADLAETVSDHL